MTTTPPRYVVSDGTLTLLLERDTESKWFSVTSPLNPKIIKQARSVEEAFEMAYDVLECLREAEAVRGVVNRIAGERRDVSPPVLDG